MNRIFRTPRAFALSGEVTLVGALREAVVTLLASLGALACTLALAPGPGPAVLVVVLCLSLSRSHLDRDWRHRLESALALPVVGMAAIGVGLLLRDLPWLGAAVFTAGLSVSIWLRRFGTTARRMGSLIALPFVTLLVTPHLAPSAGGPMPTWLLPVLIALLALAWVSAMHALARSVGLLPAVAAQPGPVAMRSRQTPAQPLDATSAPARPPGMRPDAATRMALQMAVALAASFAVGYALFGQRWAWIVLTAFIVNSRNRGRLEVAYKSVLRVAGAAAGTLLALLLARHLGGHGTGTAALILAAIFMGVWLRPLGYAWWALFVTLALALLQGFADVPAGQLLVQRLAEIAIGAVIGVASAWWVLPVRSTAVLRRRLADALAALGGALDPATPDRSSAAFAAAIDGVAQLAPAFRASRLLMRRRQDPHPADWIDALLACRVPAVALIERNETPAEVHRAVGAARKAQLEPATLLPALHDLSRCLEGHVAQPPEAD